MTDKEFDLFADTEYAAKPKKKNSSKEFDLFGGTEYSENPEPVAKEQPAIPSVDPYAGLNPIERLAVETYKNPVTNTIANTTKDFTRGVLRMTGGTLSGINAWQEVNPIAPEGPSLVGMAGQALTNLSENPALQTPQTELQKKIGEGDLLDAAGYAVQNPMDTAKTIGKFTVENMPTVLGAAFTGGTSLYPELTGYSFQRQLENGVDKEKAALLASAEGVVSAKIENLMGAVPVFKQLLSGKATKEAAKAEIKTILQKGMSVVGGTAKTAGEETLEESAQQILSNFVDNVSGVETDILSGVPESAAGGFLAGLGLGAGGHVMTEISTPTKEFQEKPLERLPRAQHNIKPQQSSFGIEDVEMDVYDQYNGPNEVDQLLDNEAYEGLEQSELIKQQMEEEVQVINTLKEERDSVLGQINNKYGNVGELRKRLAKGSSEEGDIELLNELVELEQGLVEFGAIDEVTSVDTSGANLNFQKPVEQVKEETIEGIPDEGVEYIPAKKKPQRKNIPDDYRLYAENANQFDSYMKWRDYLKEELSDSEYQEFRDELKSIGFSGLKNFYKNRERVNPVSTKLPKFDYTSEKQSKGVPQTIQHKVNDTQGQDEAFDNEYVESLDTTAHRGEEIESIEHNPYSDVIPDEEMIKLLNDPAIKDSDIDGIAEVRRANKKEPKDFIDEHIAVGTVPDGKQEKLNKLNDSIDKANNIYKKVKENYIKKRKSYLDREKAHLNDYDEQISNLEEDANEHIKGIGVAKKIENIKGLIEDKNKAELSSILSNLNAPVSRVIYEELTGKKLPKTISGTKKFIEEKYSNADKSEPTADTDTSAQQDTENQKDNPEVTEPAETVEQEAGPESVEKKKWDIDPQSPPEVKDITNFLKGDESTANKVFNAFMKEKQDQWDKYPMRTKEVKNVIRKVLGDENNDRVNPIIAILSRHDNNQKKTEEKQKSESVAPAKRYKIRGKLYEFIKEEEVADDILEFKKELKDVKGNSYTLIKNRLTKNYVLYNGTKKLFTFANLKEAPSKTKPVVKKENEVRKNMDSSLYTYRRANGYLQGVLKLKNGDGTDYYRQTDNPKLKQLQELQKKAEALYDSGMSEWDQLRSKNKDLNRKYVSEGYHHQLNAVLLSERQQEKEKSLSKFMDFFSKDTEVQDLVEKNAPEKTIIKKIKEKSVDKLLENFEDGQPLIDSIFDYNSDSRLVEALIKYSFSDNAKPKKSGYTNVTNEDSKDAKRSSIQNDRKRTRNARPETISKGNTVDESGQGLVNSTSDEHHEDGGLDGARTDRISSGGDGRLTESDKELVNKEFKNRAQLNKAIKGWIQDKGYENYSVIPDEIQNWLKKYTGAGGVKGAEGSGILDEYYTPEKLVDKMWGLARAHTDGNMAFEPSMGIGRFFEFAPQGYSLNGVEYDNTSGKIAQLLYPDSDIKINPFQETFLREDGRLMPDKENPEIGRYDVVIGNPPYKQNEGKYKAVDNKNKAARLEEYFIDRGLDLLKDGGVLVYVIPRGVLNNEVTQVKQAIAKKGNLIDAYRLPDGVFQDTGVGTDIIVIKKEPGNIEDFTGGSFFESNPDKVLGKLSDKKGQWGSDIYTGDISVLDNISTKNIPVKKSTKLKAKEVKKEETSKKAEPKATKKVKESKENIPNESPVEYKEYQTENKMSEKEKVVWQRLQYDNSVDLPTNHAPELLNYFDGKVYHNVYYLDGNLYLKLEQLEIDKSKMSEEQYNKQKNLIEKILIKQSVKEFTVDPLSKFGKSLMSGNKIKDTGWTYKDGRSREKTYERETSVIEEFKPYLESSSTEDRESFDVSDLLILLRGDEPFPLMNPKKGWDGKTIPLTKEEIKSNQRQLERQAKSRTILERIFNDFIRNEISDSSKKIIEDKFNREFNAVVKQDLMSIPLFVKGMSSTFKGTKLKLLPQQIKGINFLTTKGTGCLAYGTGLGKTITGIIATVQNMQMGRCKRPVFVVPGNTLEKWIFETKELFPNIKINNLGNMGVKVDEIDIEEGSLTFVTHDFITNVWYKSPEVLEKFKDEAYTQSTRPEITGMLPQTDKQKKQQERAFAKAESFISKAKSANNNSKRKELFYIDKLGFDHITVDETHLVFTKGVFEGKTGRNEVRGTQGTTSQSGAAMFLLHQYILGQNNYRNAFHLTATPFENRIVEIYNMLSYVGRYRLAQMNLLNVHDFMDYFIDVEARQVPTNDMSEIKTEKQVRAFKNAGVFKRLIAEFIDYESSAEVNKPEKHTITVELEKSPAQEAKSKAVKKLAKDLKSAGGKEGKAAALIYMGKERLNSLSPHLADIPLAKEKEARKEYLASVTPKEFVEDSPKLLYTIESIKAVLEDDPDTSQILYMDTGTAFFGHIKKYVVERGILKANQIITTEETNDKQKIADKLNDRDNPVRLLIGSSKISTGMDLQENTSVLYNLSNDYNPTTQVQVEGRLWRQGNPYKNVRVVYPFIKNSSDVFMFRILADKTARLNDIYNLDDGDNYIDVEEVHPDKYIEELITDPDMKYEVYIDSARTILEHKKDTMKDKVTSINRMEREYGNAKYLFKKYTEKLEKLEPQLKEYRAKLKENPDYSYYKDKVEEGKKEVADAKYFIKRSKGQINFWEKRIKQNKVNLDNVEAEKEELNKQILSLENEIENIEANAENKKQEFRQQYIESQEKALSIDELIKEVKIENKKLLEKDSNKIQQLRQRKQKHKARRGSVYVGSVSWSRVKDNIVKSYNTLQKALTEFAKFSFNPGRYLVAKAHGKYHIVKDVEVETNTPENIDTLPMQDCISRMSTILKRNKHTWQVYLDAKQHERDFSKIINQQNELLLTVERNLGTNISNLMDYVEGTKAIPESQKKNVEYIKKVLDMQGSRVLESLINSGYLKPVTQFEKGKGTKVYTSDGQTLIGEAFSKKEVNKLFEDYMKKTWKKENYFPHVFKGFYPVLAQKADGSKHFIGRAFTTGDAKKVYDDYIKENPDKTEEFTGKVTLDTELSRDDNEYVLVGLPDLKKIKDKLNDEDSDFELTSEEVSEIQSLFVPKRDVKKARRVGHSYKRENYEGYVKDPVEALQAYFYRTEKFIQDAKFLKKSASNMAKAKLGGIQSQQKNLYEQSLAYIKAVTGERYADEKFVAEMTKAVFEKCGMANMVDYNWYPKVLKAIRNFEYKAKLGIRLDHLLIQPALLFTNVYPELSAVGNKIGDGEKYTWIGTRQAATSLVDERMREILKESQIFDAGFIESMESAVGANSGLKKKLELAQLRWKSDNKKKAVGSGLELVGDMWMLSFSLGDKMPRAVAFWGRFQQILDNRNIDDFYSLSKEEQSTIIRRAADFSDYTNHKYSIIDAPALFRSQTGKTFLQFKQFMVFQLGLWKDMLLRDSKMMINALKANDLGRILKATPTLKSMLLVALIFGVTGIPFAQDLSDLFEKAFKVNPVMELRKNDIARAGLPALVGIDLAASGDIRLQQLIPMDLDKWRIDVARISPTFGSAKNVKDFLAKIGDGVDIGEATSDLLKREIPAARRAIEGKWGFKTLEKSKESFKKWEYSKLNSRKMRRLVKYNLNGDDKKFKDLATNIAKSGYYDNAKSMERGFNSVKGYMRRIEFAKIRESIKANNKNKAFKLRESVIEQFYKGNAAEFDSDFGKYYKRYSN